MSTWIGSLTGYRVPEDLTTELLKDATYGSGDVSEMSRRQLLTLWGEVTGNDVDVDAPEPFAPRIEVTT